MAPQILLQHVDAGLWPAAVKQAPELREATALGDDDAMQLDRLPCEGDIHDQTRKFWQRDLRRQHQQALEIAVHDLPAERVDHAGEQHLLAAEVTVDRHLGDAGLRRDVVHAGSAEALRQELGLARLQDLRTLLRRQRAPVPIARANGA